MLFCGAFSQPIREGPIVNRSRLLLVVLLLIVIEGAVEDVHEGEHGVIARGHTSNGKNFRAVVATYQNSPDTRSKRRIIGIDNVTAQVELVTFDGTEVRPRYGAWLSEKDRKVRFEVAGKHDLIAATIEGDDLYAVERK
jgi:hypothetical protein